MKIRRGQNLRTRYAYTRQNAKTLTAMLELATKRLRSMANIATIDDRGAALIQVSRHELAAEALTFAGECDRIVAECGIQERGR